MIERRAFCEVRAQARRLEGLAARFGVEARIADFTEVIAPGAFARALADGRDVLALVDHDATRVLARTKSGTLKLSETADGLSFTIDLPATSLANDVLALAERGDLGGMSFGFRVPTGGDSWQGSKRTLNAIDLVEVSVVQAFPAYDGTVIAARSRGASGQAVRRLWLETVR